MLIEIPRAHDDTSGREIVNEGTSIPVSEWANIDDLNNERTISQESQSAFQTHPWRTEISRDQLVLLEKGNEIGWRRPAGYWHEAILSEVDTRNRKIMVIHNGKEDRKFKVKEEWIDVDNESGDLYRFDYSADILNQNPADEVIERARSKIGEQEYSLRSNNCEHFATYCKTDKKESAQVNWAEQKFAEVNTTCRCIAKDTVKTLIDDVAPTILRNVGIVAAAEGMKRMVKGSNLTGAAGVFALEGMSCGYDIWQILKARREDKITVRDCQVSVTQRFSEALSASSLAVIGSTLGGFACPVLGNVLGGGLGSLLGKFAGVIVRLRIGNWLFPRGST